MTRFYQTVVVIVIYIAALTNCSTISTSSLPTTVSKGSIKDRLQCYHCDSTKEKKATCKDGYRVLKKARKTGGEEDVLVKTCVPEKNEILCFIQQEKTLDGHDGYLKAASHILAKLDVVDCHGVTESFIRDCSDGHTFDFSTKDYPRLALVSATNRSTCSVKGDKEVCIWLCTGSFCNGPSAAVSLRAETLWSVNFMLTLILHICIFWSY